MPPDQYNSSFIPKRSPQKKTRSRSSAKTNILINTVVGAIFGSVLLVSIALIGYEWYLNNQFQAVVIELDQQSESFSDADLSRVIDFDRRLSEANRLFDEHISINRILTAVADFTVSPVQFTDLTITREDRDLIRVNGTIETIDLGVILAQRAIYESTDILGGVAMEELKLAYSGGVDGSSNSETNEVAQEFTQISLSLDFSPDTVLYQGAGSANTSFNPTQSMQVSEEIDISGRGIENEGLGEIINENI